MTARTFIIAAAAAALAGGPVHGQPAQWYESRTGLLWTGSKSVRIETVDQALGLLMTGEDGPVRDIMDGSLLDLTEAERNDLADRLGALILADTTQYGLVATDAKLLLSGAAKYHGHGYSFDVLIRTYERAVALGHEDRLNVLGWIESADPERGRAYVLGVFEAAQAPPDCFRDGDWLREPGDDRPECTSRHRDTTFCRAGDVLYAAHVRARVKNPEVLDWTDGPQRAYEAVGLEGNAARWWDRCWGRN